VTVKCRIGIDERDDYEFFAAFVEAVAGADLAALIVHARAAVLGGLSPKENREIPPLRHEYVHRLKRERPELPIVLNGGLDDVATVCAAIGSLDGVMLGRAAYHRPRLLAELQQAMIDPQRLPPEPEEVLDAMVAYARRERRKGVRLHSITRHMHGLIVAREGARAWRRFLSEIATRSDAEPETLYGALPILRPPQAA
jgi:tRNA-dihydrouridine synthase A